MLANAKMLNCKNNVTSTWNVKHKAPLKQSCSKYSMISST